ncbi:MAG: hypothetical protein D6788_04315 [Planctomycetota bacterium]|nr:MAG: hypothetical protein D6788_04315 [Planctomycetota bacterium]
MTGKRFWRGIVLLVIGSTFTMVSCRDQQVDQILADGITGTTVGLVELFVQSAVNNAFQLE